MIKSQSLTDIRAMLLTLFIVITNETDGVNINTELETPCEQHKNRLLHTTSTGFQDFQDTFNEILASNEVVDHARTMLEEEYERQNEGLNNFENPFQAWANSVYNESKNLIKEGTGINPFYCPSLVPILIKSLKLLPLWSEVMIPIFGFGEEVASSAAVESCFRKLKTLTLKNITLPTSVEIFLENHIVSLKGTSLIRGSTYLVNENPNLCEHPDLPNTQFDSANTYSTQLQSPEHQNENTYNENISLTLSNSPEHQNQNTDNDNVFLTLSNIPEQQNNLDE